MLIACVILMMIDVVMHGQGRVTRRTMKFLPLKFFCWLSCICSGVVVLAMEVPRFWVTITWSFIDAYTSRIARGQSTLTDVIERYFWNGLSRERLKAMKALYALYAKYAIVLVEKRTKKGKSEI